MGVIAKKKNGKCLYREVMNVYLHVLMERYKRFQKTIERLGLSSAHRPHDPRKTFVIMAKRMGVNEYAVKRIIGHEITDCDFNWLVEEIEKL